MGPVRSAPPLLVLVLALALPGCGGLASLPRPPAGSAPSPAAGDPAGGPWEQCCAVETPSYHHLPTLSPRQAAERYRIEVTTEPSPPTAGAETRVTVRVAGPGEGGGLGLSPFRERRPHFILVSENLEEFRHLHPEDLGEWKEQALFEGSFSFSHVFRQGGRHVLALDFADGGVAVHHAAELRVGGPAQGPYVPAPERRRTVAGVEAVLDLDPYEPRVVGLMNANVVLTEGGRPVTDLQVFGGALAHLVIVSAGAETVRHLHGGSDLFGHFQRQVGPPDYRGPKLYFSPAYGPAGPHRLFVLFRRGGVLHTVPFDADVLPRPPDLP